MKNHFTFNKTTNQDLLDHFIQEWQQTITAPQDGMWESITSSSTHWLLSENDSNLGYAVTDDNNRLLQFYVSPAYLDIGIELLGAFIQENEIKSALIGTNNPITLSLNLHFQKSILIDTYLFNDVKKVQLIKEPGTLSLANLDDLESLVAFYHSSIGAPKEWLNFYLSNLINEEELYVLTDSVEILGACEVRKSQSNTAIADIGMVVSENHRRKGIGTFLLGRAKELAYIEGRQPICSCEKTNIGSLKSIQNCGFRSIHQMLAISF